MKSTVFVTLLLTTVLSLQAQEKESLKTFEVYKSDADWKKQLSGMEYYVLRRGGTEYAFTSELLDEKRKGTYVCAACENPVFRSEYKYDSNSGWPSFDRPIEGSLVYDVDYEIGYERTEEKCGKCGSHLGHVFDDGPRATTGKRHCINGVALKFIADAN